MMRFIRRNARSGSLRRPNSFSLHLVTKRGLSRRGITGSRWLGAVQPRVLSLMEMVA
jgi:hypothetical protein